MEILVSIAATKKKENFPMKIKYSSGKFAQTQANGKEKLLRLISNENDDVNRITIMGMENACCFVVDSRSVNVENYIKKLLHSLKSSEKFS